MIEKVNTKLVIDASIVRSSGGIKSKNLGSRNCSIFLDEVRKGLFYVVMTAKIRSEWNKHQSLFSVEYQSLFSVEWRAEMLQKRRIITIREQDLQDLRSILENKIKSLPEKDGNIKKAMLKDCLLIEAALATDKIVISSDKRVRNHFRKASQTIEELRDILWVNPNNEKDQAIDWLKDGAKIEPKRLLGFGQQ
ncbi:MAG: hypothetical protein AAGA80_23375 [Cyanobacteria bacterium P01_F01_bin.143]